jgi:AcrR family transcriptional regulator
MAERSKAIGPAQWCEAALLALGEKGPGAIAVEPLAMRLGVTKGSFYWHFRDRAALIQAVGAFWETKACDEVITALSLVEDPRTRVLKLFQTAFDAVEHLRAERALSAAADALGLSDVIQRVHARRHGFLQASYAQLGMTPAASHHRATLVYATYLGALQLVDTPLLANTTALRKWVSALEATLVPSDLPAPRKKR